MLQIVKVQINDGTTMSGPRDGGRKSLPMFSPGIETPVHVAKPLPKTSSVLEIKNPTLVFPKTAAGESSGNFQLSERCPQGSLAHCDFGTLSYRCIQFI